MSSINNKSAPVDWKQLQQQKPYEIVLSGEKISKQIEDENGLSEIVYGIKSLNLLEITNTNALCTISAKIDQLANLTNLILQGNKLTSIPEQVGSLIKLKCLDFARNELSELPSNIFEKLSSLQTLNVEQNQLTSLPNMSRLSSLIVLKCGSNRIETFPNSLCDGAFHLSELEASHNRMPAMPSKISVLVALKRLDLSDNQITLVPRELADCPKLKDLNLKQNPIKDRRLYKLIEQCTTKKVLDYVKANVAPAKCDKPSANDGQAGDIENSVNRSITVDSKFDPDPFKIIVSKSILMMRKIVACILHGVDISNPKVMKKFIAIQTKLHQGVCDNRQKATIATHDLAKIVPKTTFALAAANSTNAAAPVEQPPRMAYFEGKVPTKIKLTPLGRSAEMTAMQLYRQLNEEADQYRKEKKRNNISGIHKYLHLLKGKQLYPVLLDSSNHVLSLPPLTNADYSKIEANTTEILVEVTGESVPTCRQVMNELIESLINLTVESDTGATLNLFNSSKQNVLGLDGKVSSSGSDVAHMLIEPVTVTIQDSGELVVKYPSRIDLSFENVQVNFV